MKLKSGGEEGLKEENSGQHQHRLPSIVETDPAVAQAVRSAEPFYPQPMMPQVSYANISLSQMQRFTVDVKMFKTLCNCY